MFKRVTTFVRQWRIDNLRADLRHARNQARRARASYVQALEDVRTGKMRTESDAAAQMEAIALYWEGRIERIRKKLKKLEPPP